MKHCKLSFVLILLALAWSLSTASLLANGPPSPEQKSKSPSQHTQSNIQKLADAPKDSQPHGANEKRNTDQDKREPDKPVEVKILESDYLNKSSDQDKANKTENLEIQRKLTLYTLALALIAALQIAVLIAQVCYNRSLAVQQRIVERAYIRIKYSKPGLTASPPPESTVQVFTEIKNIGQTPAKVSDVKCFFRLLLDGQQLPEGPDYTGDMGGDRQFFFHKDDDFMIRRVFPIGQDDMASINAFDKHLYIYGYVDYLDKFGQRHRSGYAWHYSPGSTPQNLGAVAKPKYNYDRNRPKGEGIDWPPA